MARIPENKIQEVLTKTNIVEEVSKYTNLHKQGRNYVGLCLFHADQTPSMIVSPDKKIFKCFSCGVGGNIIQFVEKINNLVFPLAVIKLAKEYGIDLGNVDDYIPKDPYSSEQKLLFKINEDATNYYQAVLYNKVGIMARNYLDQRQIDRDQIGQWQIGFAYENNLVQHLLGLGYAEGEIVKAGLATTNQASQKTYDYFQNRITFPVKNKDGYVIGFSARVLDQEKPKYLNTRETLIFKKSEVMFNIDYVLKNKERFANIIVLEGFMDVISLTKVGYPNCLALMGTNLSAFQINILKQLKKPIKLFLDGDGPGINAMYKIAKLLINNDLEFSIVDNLTAMDPDELVQTNQVEALKKMVDHSINVYEFFLEKFTLNEVINVDKKTTIIEQIFALLKYEKNLLVVDGVFDQLSNKLNISKEILINSFKQKQSQNLQKKVTNWSSPQILNDNNQFSLKPKTRKEDMKLKVLIALLQSKDYLTEIKDNLVYLAGADQHSYYFQQVCNTLINYYLEDKYQGNDLERFFSLLSAEKSKLLQTSVAQLKMILNQPLAKENFKMHLSSKGLEDIIWQAKFDQLSQEISDGNDELKALELQVDQNNFDPDKVRVLSGEKSKKQKELLILLKQKSELIALKNAKK